MARLMYGSEGPLSQLGDTLEDILSNRRSIARQAMLDQLNAKNVQSEMDYRQQQAQSLAEERAARAKEWEMFGEYRKAQADKQAQDEARLGNEATFLKNYMSSPDFASLEPNMKAALTFAANNPDDRIMGAMINRLLATPSKGAGHLITVNNAGKAIDAATGQPFTDQLGPYDKVVDLHNPPVPRLPQNHTFWLNGPKGEHVPVNEDLTSLGSGPIPIPKGYEGYTWASEGNNPNLGQPKAASNKPWQFPAADSKNLALVKSKLPKFDPSSKDAWLTDPNVVAYRTMLGGLLGNYQRATGVPREVASDAFDILTSPEAQGRTFDQLMQSGAITPAPGIENYNDQLKTALQQFGVQ